jgi:hypothetical protein
MVEVHSPADGMFVEEFQIIAVEIPTFGGRN